MASEKIDICNMALNYLGSASVSSLDVDSSQDSSSKKAIRLCNLFFDQAKEEALVRYRWRCSLKRAILAQDVTTPAFDWEYQFVLPIDVLRVLQMEYKDQAFSVEGDRLLTNWATAKILYIKNIVNFGELHPYAVDVIAHHLAIKMSVALRGEDGVNLKQELMQNLRQEILPEAKATNALEGLESDFQKVVSTEWTRARHMRRSNHLTNVANG